MTTFQDDPVRCENCDADLSGPDGVRLGTGLVDEDVLDLPSLDAVDDPASPVGDRVEDPLPTSADDERSPVLSEAAEPPPVEPQSRPIVGGDALPPPIQARIESQPPGDGGPTPDPSRSGYLPGPTTELPVESTAAFTPRADANPSVPKSGSASRTDPDHLGVRPDQAAEAPDPDAANVGSPDDIEPQGRPTMVLDGGPKPEPRIGEVACDRCRQPNPLSRRYCLECGGPLPALFEDATVELEAPPPPDTWWRRLTGTTAHGEVDKRTWRQRAKDSGQHRSRFGTRTLETRLFAAGLIAAFVMSVAALVLFWQDLFGDEPDVIRPVAVELLSGDPLRTHPPQGAFDQDHDTGFGLEIQIVEGESSETVPEEGTVPVETDAVFEIRLAEPVDVAALDLDVGFDLDAQKLDPALFLKPALLVVEGLTSEIQTIAVAQTDERQRLEVASDGQSVSSFRIRIDRVHTERWETYEIVMIVEIGVVAN